jgi:hypothetical protein
MKMRAMAVDANGRSYWSTVDIPLIQAGPTSAVSNKQDAQYWGLALNQPGEPIAGGPDEMHLTHVPRIVWVMSGHNQITMQDGEVFRMGVGEGVYVNGDALHHSAMIAWQPTVTLNVTFPGRVDYRFK